MFSHFYLFVFHNTNNLFKILQIFIMLTEKLKQSTVYGSILTLETVQDTAGKTDRVKIQIQFLVLTLLFQSLSFCRTAATDEDALKRHNQKYQKFLRLRCPVLR